MKYSIRTQHIELSEFDQRLLTKKVERLKKHVSPPYVMDISIIGENHRNNNEAVTCRINIQEGGKVYHTERTAENAENAMDQAVQALHNEIMRAHERMEV